MPGDLDAKEVVDLTELSDTEDDLVVCRVSLPQKQPVSTSAECRFSLHSHDSPRFGPRHEQSCYDLHRQSRGPPFQPYVVTALRPVGPLAAHYPPQNVASCDFPTKSSIASGPPTTHREPMSKLSSSPRVSNRPYRNGALNVGTPPYETPYHHRPAVAPHLGNGALIRDSPNLRCVAAMMRQARESVTTCNDQRKLTTPMNLDSVAFSKKLSQRHQQHGPAGIMGHPQLPRQGEWNFVERQDEFLPTASALPLQSDSCLRHMITMSPRCGIEDGKDCLDRTKMRVICPRASREKQEKVYINQKYIQFLPPPTQPKDMEAPPRIIDNVTFPAASPHFDAAEPSASAPHPLPPSNAPPHSTAADEAKAEASSLSHVDVDANKTRAASAMNDSSLSHKSISSAGDSKTSLVDDGSLLNTLPLPSTSLTRDLDLPSSSFTHLPSRTPTRSISFTNQVSKVLPSPGAFMEEDDPIPPPSPLKQTQLLVSLQPHPTCGCALSEDQNKVELSIRNRLANDYASDGYLEVVCVSSSEEEEEEAGDRGDGARTLTAAIASTKNSVVDPSPLSVGYATDRESTRIIIPDRNEELDSEETLDCSTEEDAFSLKGKTVPDQDAPVGERRATEEEEKEKSFLSTDGDFDRDFDPSDSNGPPLLSQDVNFTQDESVGNRNGIAAFEKEDDYERDEGDGDDDDDDDDDGGRRDLVAEIGSGSTREETTRGVRPEAIETIQMAEMMEIKSGDAERCQHAPVLQSGNAEWPQLTPVLQRGSRTRRPPILSDYVKIQVTRPRGRPPNAGRGIEKGIGPKKRPYLQFARTLWSADNRRRTELENPGLTSAEIEQKLKDDFDALDVKEQLKEVRRAKSVVGPDLKSVEEEREKREKQEKKETVRKRTMQRAKSQADAKLNGRVRRTLLALFSEFKKPQQQRGGADNPVDGGGTNPSTCLVVGQRRAMGPKMLFNMKRRDGELAEMRKLLKASSASKSSPRLRLLNSVYERLGEGGRKTMLGLYLARMSDVFARDEYRMFVDAFKLIVKEMYPSIVESARKPGLQDPWKRLKGPKLDFLKGKLELIFPKVLGRTLRKSSAPGEAPVLTEALIFREALCILDPCDAKIAEVALKDREAETKSSETARLLAQRHASTGKIKSEKERVGSMRHKVPGRQKLLEMLEETMEAEEDGEVEFDDDEEEEGEISKDMEKGKCQVGLEDDADRELAPLPQTGDFPLPLTSSSRTDLIDPSSDVSMPPKGAVDEQRSLTHISGITDISVPFHINASDLSMGEFYRSVSANTSRRETGAGASLPPFLVAPSSKALHPSVEGVEAPALPPDQREPRGVGAPHLTIDSFDPPPFSFKVALTDQGLFVPIENCAASSPRENPQGADVSHEVIIAGTDNDDTADEEEDNQKNVADDDEYNADDDDDDDDDEDEDDDDDDNDEEEEREEVTGGETYAHSPTTIVIQAQLSSRSERAATGFQGDQPLVFPESRVLTPERIRRDPGPAEESDPASKHSFGETEVDGPVSRVAPLVTSNVTPPPFDASDQSSLERSSGSTQPFVSGKRGPGSKESNLNESRMSVTEGTLHNSSASVDALTFAGVERRSDKAIVETEDGGNCVVNDEQMETLDDHFKDLPSILDEDFAYELLLDAHQNELLVLDPCELETFFSEL